MPAGAATGADLGGSQPHEELSTLKRALADERPQAFEDCVGWARKHFEANFNNQIRQLLFNFAPDQLTSSGVPFWSGPKRCPHHVVFDASNPVHVDYVLAAANLKAEMYGITQNRDREAVASLATAVEVIEFTPRAGVTIHVNDSEAEAASNGDNADHDELETLVKSLPTLEQLKGAVIRPLSFEKDDDSNLHMDYIVACSNLRAENYDIPPADKHKSKLIAGRIIPAIATTTSLIVGLVCLELYKLVQGHKTLEVYKNGFVNLALPFFGFSEPVAAPKKKYGEKEWTLWDCFDVTGDITLQEFLDFFKSEHGLDVTMVTQGVSIIFSPFMAKDKAQSRLATKMTAVVEEISKKMIPPQTGALVFDICCEDTEGEDIDVPYVRYALKKAPQSSYCSLS